MIDSFLRFIRPLRLRQRLYFLLRRLGWKPSDKGDPAPLALAPVSLARLCGSDFGHQQILGMGFCDLDLSLPIARLAREGGLMIDAGANIGYFSALWAAANPQNAVIAFEPSPRNLAMLKDNIESAGLSDRVKIVPHALSRETGTLSFDPGPEDQTGWGGLTTAPSSDALQVPVRRLDEELDPTTRIKVLKIDCEGADPWVIEGAAALLRARCIEHVFFEINETRQTELGIAENRGIQVLAGFGYMAKPLEHDPSVLHAPAPAQP